MEDTQDIVDGLKEINESEELKPAFEGKLIDAISDFFMSNTSWLIYKTFAEGRELDESFWEDNLSNSILLHNREGIDKDMLVVQIREATEAGYVTLANVLEDDEDEWEQLKAMNILAFDVTDSGREYIMPYIKDKLIDHFNSIITKIKEI